MDDTPARAPDDEPPPGMPQWAKVSAVVAGVVAVVVIVLLVVGGDHGPQRHVPGGEGQTEQHEPPEDVH